VVGEQDRRHPGAAAGEPGTGEERVAAVVAAPDEQDDVPAGDAATALAEERRGLGGDGCGGPLHECAGRCRRDRRRLGGPAVRDAVGGEALGAPRPDAPGRPPAPPPRHRTPGHPREPGTRGGHERSGRAVPAAAGFPGRDMQFRTGTS
jgi:hypothetical protein